MGTVIDMRENPMHDLAVAQSIGQPIGQALEKWMIQRRRNKTQSLLVTALTHGAANNTDPKQLRRNILMIPNIVETQIGQDLVQMELGTGPYAKTSRDRYYDMQMEKSRAGGGFGTRTAAQQKQLFDNFKYMNDGLLKSQAATNDYLASIGPLGELDPDKMEQLRKNTQWWQKEVDRLKKQFESQGEPEPFVPRRPKPGEPIDGVTGAARAAPSAGRVQPTTPPTNDTVKKTFDGWSRGFQGSPEPADLATRQGPGTWADTVARIPGRRAIPDIVTPPDFSQPLGGKGKPPAPAVAEPKPEPKRPHPRTSSSTFGYGPPGGRGKKVTNAEAKAEAAVVDETSLGLPAHELIPRVLQYLGHLDPESHDELMQIIAEGNANVAGISDTERAAKQARYEEKLQKALTMLEEKYGTL